MKEPVQFNNESIDILFDRLLQISPFIRSVKIQEKQGAFFGEWINDDNIFTYVKDGTLDIILDSKKYAVGKGDAFIMYPYLSHIVNTTPLAGHNSMAMTKRYDHANEERYGAAIEALDAAGKTGSAEALAAARWKRTD
ncbi:MAG: hypothetical protein ACJ0UT_06195 [Candidatus Latescibacterota bacterium]